MLQWCSLSGLVMLIWLIDLRRQNYANERDPAMRLRGLLSLASFCASRLKGFDEISSLCITRLNFKTRDICCTKDVEQTK
ncbi:hypothetical protein BX666DRAFT_1916013 [Dichotomocladium elegans]|nr:hypothetical protein BX666DRAFT_1916013 [Dichotomocladium elegans]